MPEPSAPPRRGLVRPGYGETLPALLQRTRGIPPRATLGAAAALVVLLAVLALVLRDPTGGRTRLLHADAPVFNLLYAGGLHIAKPQDGELERLEGRRGGVRVELVVRPYRLDAYRSDVVGALPIAMTRRMQELRGQTPGFRLLADGKGRISAAPGYQVGFNYGTKARRGYGLDVLVVPPETPRARDGLLLSLRQVRGPRRPPAAGRELTKAARSALRSLRFGTELDYPD